MATFGSRALPYSLLKRFNDPLLGFWSLGFVAIFGLVEVVALTAEVEHRVAGLDVGEEGIAQALALGGALHQTGDVHHVQEGGNLAVGGKRLKEKLKK